MENEFKIRRANAAQDAERLRDLFNDVFHPEEVGTLAATFFDHLPGMEKKYWFIAEDEERSQLAAAFALIPWVWEFEGLRLKVAEMGIVGTQAQYQGRGLQRILNQAFDETLAEENFVLAMIQGIPGFYEQFGYSYALPLENSINLHLHNIQDGYEGYSFRLANVVDIPFLLREDNAYRARYSIAALRDESHWRYMLTESLKTEYGSEFWIVEGDASGETFYCRMPAEGFGEGLIVSEVSEEITLAALKALFAFCKEKAIEREKPYIRLNLHNESTAGRMAIAMGAKEGKPYAWQIKFQDVPRFLKSIGPVLEKRLATSAFREYSGVFRLNFYKRKVDLVWERGRLKSVRKAEGDADTSFSISTALFVPLVLGHRSWQELRHLRPDIFPGSDTSALLVETLFPKKPAWLHEQY